MRLTILLIFLSTVSFGNMMPDQVIYLPEIVVIAKPYDQILREVFISNGISPEMTEILIAQAKHESANFTSNLFVNTNNAFGMMHPYKRPTTSLGPFGRAEGRNGYAKYRCIEESAEDIMLYLKARNIPDYKLPRQYIKHLKKKHYFEDSYYKYAKSVERCLNREIK